MAKNESRPEREGRYPAPEPISEPPDLLSAEGTIPLLLRTLMDIKESIGRLDARASHIEEDFRSLRSDVGNLRTSVGSMTDRKTFWWGILTVCGLIIALTTLIWNITGGFGTRDGSHDHPPVQEQPLKPPQPPDAPSRQGSRRSN